MPRVTVYSSGFCPYCFWAKGLLEEKDVNFDEIRIDQVAGARDEMLSKSNGRSSVPQIFIDDLHVGGFDDLQALNKAGKLDPLLAGNLE